jgi:hypothetical protein
VLNCKAKYGVLPNEINFSILIKALC